MILQTDENAAMLAEAKNREHILASGRPTPAMTEYAKELDFTLYYFVQWS
jgi:hydroxymethylpyrimidine pyrophosphatase-like HAD family hydrolase